MRWTQEQLNAYEARRGKRSDFGTKRPRDKNTCIWCSKEFFAPHSFLRKYCSYECAYADPRRVDHMKPKDRGTSKCKRCGIEFALTTKGGKGSFCSQTCAAAVNSNGNHGWVKVGGRDIYVRSQWEANYAFFLQFQKEHGLINDWEFEPDTFWFDKIKRGVRSYLPDFKVHTNGGVEYHEVKGWMDARSKTKIKRMAKYHPKVSLIVIDQKRYKEIAKTASGFVSGWGTAPCKTKIL